MPATLAYVQLCHCHNDAGDTTTRTLSLGFRAIGFMHRSKFDKLAKS